MELARRALALLVISILLAACGDNSGGGGADAPGGGADAPPGTVDADESEVPRIEPAPCRFDVDPSLGLVEGTGYTCGDLIVYENRGAPGGRTIRLHYIRVDSDAASNNATIYLDGGPGGDGQGILDYAAYLGPEFLDGLLVDGDFLVISQRGTSRSIPFLDCQAADCSDFAAIADLPSYNTAYNADDVDELRATLGIDRLDLYGISYGSRLGLEVLRRHGDHVRAALIEGLVPSQVVWPAAIPASFYSALTGLRASCNDAGACGTTYGNLLSKFLTGVDALNANPVTITSHGSGFPLDGYSYAYLLFQMFYSRSSYVWLPLVINDLAVRRTDRVNEFLAAWLEAVDFGGGISTGLYYGVVCGEIYNPPDPDAFDAANAGIPAPYIQIFGGSYFGLLDVCETYPKGDLQAELQQPVTSSVRTFVSSGRLDPITPPGFGDVAAETLSDSFHVVHENSGHGATLQTACGSQNLFAFLADPTTPHDTSCAAAIPTDYILPGSVARSRVPRAAITAEARLSAAARAAVTRVTRR